MMLVLRVGQMMVLGPDKVILHPANAAMTPLTYPPDQVQIQGVLVGQMRRYQ